MSLTVLSNIEGGEGLMEYAVRYAVAVVLWPLDLLTGWLMSCRRWIRRIIRPFLLWLPLRITPNHFTYLRIILAVPVWYLFFVYQSFAWGVILYLVACVTDFLDGALADERNENTDLGKILDALADKILNMPILISSFMIFQDIFFCSGLLINIVVDIYNALASAILAKYKKKIPGASNFGKAKYGFQCASVLLIVIQVAWYNFVIIRLFDYDISLSLVTLWTSALLGLRSAYGYSCYFLASRS